MIFPALPLEKGSTHKYETVKNFPEGLVFSKLTYKGQFFFSGELLALSNFALFIFVLSSELLRMNVTVIPSEFSELRVLHCNNYHFRTRLSSSVLQVRLRLFISQEKSRFEHLFFTFFLEKKEAKDNWEQDRDKKERIKERVDNANTSHMWFFSWLTFLKKREAYQHATSSHFLCTFGHFPVEQQNKGNSSSRRSKKMMMMGCSYFLIWSCRISETLHSAASARFFAFLTGSSYI